jgi:hypothetical protein
VVVDEAECDLTKLERAYKDKNTTKTKNKTSKKREKTVNSSSACTVFRHARVRTEIKRDFRKQNKTKRKSRNKSDQRTADDEFLQRCNHVQSRARARLADGKNVTELRVGKLVNCRDKCNKESISVNQHDRGQ